MAKGACCDVTLAAPARDFLSVLSLWPISRFTYAVE